MIGAQLALAHTQVLLEVLNRNYETHETFTSTITTAKLLLIQRVVSEVFLYIPYTFVGVGAAIILSHPEFFSNGNFHPRICNNVYTR